MARGAKVAERDGRPPPWMKPLGGCAGRGMKASENGLNGRFLSMAPRLIHRAAKREMRSKRIAGREKRHLTGDSGIAACAEISRRMGISAENPYATLVFPFRL
ncbi:MAG: hypothetical protein ACK4NA_07765 [Alphaproteobacteria bacterium]